MRLTTSPHSCAECHGNLGTSNSWNPPGHTGTCYGTALPLPLLNIYIRSLNYLLIDYDAFYVAVTVGR